MGVYKKFFDSATFKSTAISVLVAIAIGLFSYKVSQEANEIARKANETAQASYNIANEVYKSKDIPRLKASPLQARFYVPDKPEAAGQVKINFGVVIENLSETNAKDISINFETEDWYGHKTNLFNIYKEAGMPVPHILTLPKNSNVFYPSYAPDAPASGEAGFLAQDKPFKLKISLYWQDINDAKYVQVGFYELKGTRTPNAEALLYFQPLSNYDSVNDGAKAWDQEKMKF